MKKITLVLLMAFIVMGIQAQGVDYCLGAKTNGGKKIVNGESVKKDLADDQISYALTAPIKKGVKYSLLVKLKATANCSLSINAVNNASPDKDENGNSTDMQNIKVCTPSTTNFTTQRLSFTADRDCDGLDFLFGGLDGYIFFDNVKLTDTSVGVNMVTNGDFTDNSTTGWYTKTAANGTEFSLFNSGNTDVAPGEPFIPDTWDFVEQGDPNFHIYLAFGQSNMEGNAQPEAVDKQNVPERFKMMAAVNFSSPSRTMGNWYTAVPPLCRQGTGLTPCDYFGRTLVEELPEDITVGVINVAVGGARIELFMQEYKDEYIAGEAGWFQGYCAQYNNDPLGRLIEMGKKAQQKGVIKGILLHQGESNNGASDWCEKVGKIYKRICYYLGLNPAEVPLLAGETLYQDQGGSCYWHNTAALPKLKDSVPNSYVISAAGIPGNGQDPWHFSAAGYRELGKRYAAKMLEILKTQQTGIKAPAIDVPWMTGKSYDVSGRELKDVEKGKIYIKDGKKFVK